MKPNTKEYATLDNVQIVLITNRAYRVNYNKVGYWVPRSICKVHGDVITATSISIEAWWCKKNGLI